MNYYKFGKVLEQIKKNGKAGRSYPWAYVKGEAEPKVVRSVQRTLRTNNR